MFAGVCLFVEWPLEVYLLPAFILTKWRVTIECVTFRSLPANLCLFAYLYGGDLHQITCLTVAVCTTMPGTMIPAFFAKVWPLPRTTLPRLTYRTRWGGDDVRTCDGGAFWLQPVQLLP